MLFHYTSLRSFLEIMEGVRDGKMNLWASSAFAMNDPSEMQLGYEFLRSFLIEFEKGKFDDKLLYNLMPPCDKHLFKIDDDIYHFNKGNTPFIVSFSENEDNLPMWLLYGDRGKGICLGFDEVLLDNFFSPPDFFLQPVAYEDITSYDRNILCSLAESIAIAVGDFYEIKKSLQNKADEDIYARFVLSQICAFVGAFIKNKDYHFENEVRLMVLGNLEDPGVCVRQNMRQRIIPYKEIEVPIDCLKKITLGPCISTKENMTCINSYLKRFSLGDIVAFSKALYRD